MSFGNLFYGICIWGVTSFSGSTKERLYVIRILVGWFYRFNFTEAYEQNEYDRLLCWSAGVWS